MIEIYNLKTTINLLSALPSDMALPVLHGMLKGESQITVDSSVPFSEICDVFKWLDMLKSKGVSFKMSKDDYSKLERDLNEDKRQVVGEWAVRLGLIP